MKKILIILAVVALGLIILSIIFQRLEPLLGLLGIGGLGLGHTMGGGKPPVPSTKKMKKERDKLLSEAATRAEEAGKTTYEQERKRLEAMTDEEVLNSLPDDVASAFDKARKRYLARGR